ncbi:MAG TPA: DNA gyrase inhibitor YacG [Alphaproteobacteria bacterium]|nr:DNA gyrase inhibitor YacG [Alphaproteobacteria bacterium]
MTDRSKSTSGDNVVPLRPRRKSSPCPICGKPSVAEYRPFCSKRCADIDLHKWLGEDYRVPSQELPDWGEDQ